MHAKEGTPTIFVQDPDARASLERLSVVFPELAALFSECIEEVQSVPKRVSEILQAHRQKLVAAKNDQISRVTHDTESVRSVADAKLPVHDISAHAQDFWPVARKQSDEFDKSKRECEELKRERDSLKTRLDAWMRERKLLESQLDQARSEVSDLLRQKAERCSAPAPTDVPSHEQVIERPRESERKKRAWDQKLQDLQKRIERAKREIREARMDPNLVENIRVRKILDLVMDSSDQRSERLQTVYAELR
jgi:chromosome segregation ATPase